VGLRVAPTTDPDLGIVELSDYDVLKILRNWDTMSRVKRPKGKRPNPHHEPVD
jgi:hypothetical protein